MLSDQILSHLQSVIETPEPSPTTPDLTGTKYELLEEIGRGGMGSVYLVRDRELERDVALKVLDILSNPSLNASEARILAHLEHPGIVPVHDAGTLADGRAYYAMKFVQGQRLDVYARTQPPLAEMLRVFVRVCEPVAFAHSQGVVHRDLKPENIMTGSFGEVLVLDWGVAKTASETATQGTVIGTREYMAPEQAAGNVDQVDAKSDIYALGRILSYLLSACCGDAIPRPLRAIAAKAADPDRAARYASALDLAADIERYLQGQPVAAYRENFLERSNRLLAKNKTLVSLLAAYILMRSVIFLVCRR
ncbi:MAG: serine/threonine protein kinase [Acidobacteriota bacterium]|nr:serine/threonine protein kinase [Acidobacteriota bacterium]